MMTAASTFRTPFVIDLNQDHDYNQFFTYISEPADYHQAAASSSSSLPCPIFSNPPQEEAEYYHMESQPLQHQEMVNYGGSYDHQAPRNENIDNSIEFYMCKEEDTSENQSEINSSSTVKWMSSKMRLMRKMMSSDQTMTSDTPESSIRRYEDHKFQSTQKRTDNIISSNNNSTMFNGNNIVRVCADCNTTKTPLWRSGPRGPKSLCNACGIRQRKARRAMAAAAAAAAAGANGTFFAAADHTSPSMKTTTKVQHKEKKTISNSHLPYKKRCKFTAHQARGRSKKLCNFEDLAIILSKNSAFQRVFPQDEKEGAILLMALSYGLVHG